jgi:hypothetical protein
MLLTFLNHQWTGFWRSKSKSGTIAAQLVIGFLVLYIIAVSILVGYSMGEIIEKFFPGKEIMTVFNGLILYYYAIEFLIRMQIQELPTLAVVPYLHLNIPKQKLVNFLNVSAIFSAFNILPIFLFFPFIIMNVRVEYSLFACIGYLVTILSLTVFSNYAALYIKRISTGNMKIVLPGLFVLLIVGGLEYFHIFSITSISNIIFQTIASYPLTAILFIALATFIFLTNARYLKRNLYIEELKSSIEKKSSTDYPFLDRFGEAGTLVALEIKLILRNRRPRATVSKGLIFLFYGFLFYQKGIMESNQFGKMLFSAVFMTGNMILLYGQFMFGWQGAEFDGLLANNINIRIFFKAKLLMLTLSASVLTLITSLYGLLSWKLVLIQLSAYLYNIGIGVIIVLYFATRNYKYIDLKKGTNFNWQGVGASTMLMSLPILLIPYLIYLPLSVLINPYCGLGCIAIVGIAGLCARKYWLQMLVDAFNKRKYKIAAGFREQS